MLANVFDWCRHCISARRNCSTNCRRYHQQRWKRAGSGTPNSCLYFAVSYLNFGLFRYHRWWWWTSRHSCHFDSPFSMTIYRATYIRDLVRYWTCALKCCDSSRQRKDFYFALCARLCFVLRKLSYSIPVYLYLHYHSHHRPVHPWPNVIRGAGYHIILACVQVDVLGLKVKLIVVKAGQGKGRGITM